jgi:signal transduction histidine kinase
VAPAGSTPDWEQRYEQLLVLVPWLLLVPSVAINQATAGQSAADRIGTLALVAVAAAWVYGWHTRVRRQHWERPSLAAVYFAGLLVLFGALMARDTIYVLFAIAGFFHAYQVKPWPLGVAAVLGTSVVLNTTVSGVPEATVGSLGSYLGVVAVQTAAVGAGIVFAEKAGDQQRRRDEMVARLEATLEENAGLHAQLLTQAREAGVLDERQRMAREIHDTLAQGLAGIITRSRRHSGSGPIRHRPGPSWTGPSRWRRRTSRRPADRCRPCSHHSWRRHGCPTPSPSSPADGPVRPRSGHVWRSPESRCR